MVGHRDNVRLLSFGKPAAPSGIVSILRNWGVCGSG